MQHMRFTNGGFCLHKITGDFTGKVSAWFDRNGTLLDAEQITRPFESSRPLKRDGPMWRYVAHIGQRLKNIPVE
jgi:hypothetical protein